MATAVLGVQPGTRQRSVLDCGLRRNDDKGLLTACPFVLREIEGERTGLLGELA